MLAKKVLSKCPGLVTGKRCRLGFVSGASAFSSKASDGSSFASSLSESSKPLHRQSRSFSSGTAASPPQKPPASAPAAPGTDYISLFQPSAGNALTTEVGAYVPGRVLKVYPLPRYVLKEDVIRHVGNLKTENVKLVYNATFRPDYVQFEVDSAVTQRRITKRLQERGRLGYRILKAEVAAPAHWTVVDASLKDSPRGRTVVMYNVNMATDHEDVERFFSGYNFDASHIRFIRVTPAQQAEKRLFGKQMSFLHVAVGFETRLEALRAVREKTGDFCANQSVNLRLIQ